jgi:hypothetical protein
MECRSATSVCLSLETLFIHFLDALSEKGRNELFDVSAGLASLRASHKDARK